MINTLLRILTLLVALLERAAAAETKRAQDALTQASALTQKATGHRGKANFARKVAGGLRDVQS